MTVGELIANFVGDLVGGTYSNGSDERMFADQWFDRCWFGMFRGHNVCLVKVKHGIRKMTPHECFNTQGFPPNFKLPTDTADSKLYKQAGNSVCVSVIERIAENIEIAFNSINNN